MTPRSDNTATPSLRSRLRAGEPVIGTWLNTASPIVAELLAAAGFDFVTLDAEHSPVDVPQALPLFQAIRSGSPECSGLVRVAGSSYDEVKRFMDAGAAGVICPFVNTAEQAREVVRAVKYPPLGARGVGFCRDNVYGADLGERVGSANDDALVCVQIEHVDAVARIDEILAVEGVDAAFVGPYDLSASMGVTAQFEHPDYLAAKATVLAACERHGIAPGVHVVQPDVDEVLQSIDKGYRLIAYSLDITMLNHMSRTGLEAIRAGLDKR